MPLKKQTNGAGAWSSGIILSGTLNNGSKFTLVNSSISSACYSTTSANISTTAAEMTFNGNDAVGLFKTECLSISLEPSMAERLILLPM
jgi:hypothetical protein